MIAQVTEIAPSRGSGRLTAEQVLENYRLIDDQFVPTFAELQVVFERYGGQLLKHVKRPNLYALELPGKSLVGSRTAIWDWYRRHREALEAMRLATLPF